MVRNLTQLTIAAIGASALMTSAQGSGTYYNLGAGRSPSGVSGDGSVAAGPTASLQPYFIWKLSNPGVTTLIPNTLSAGSGVGGQAQISDDGDKISCSMNGFVGVPPIPPTVTAQAGVYDVSDNTLSGLGGIGWFSGTETAGGWNISGDGRVLVGLGWSPNQTNAYAVVSIDNDPLVALPWMVPGRSTRANDCSYDGHVVVGWQDNPFGFRGAAVWTNGVGQRLFLEYPKKPLGEALACSADGNWVTGVGNDNTNSQAWRWSQSTGVQLLGELNPAAGFNAVAPGMSADGNTIVGREGAGPGTFVGWIWTSSGGMQDLTTYVMDNGVTLPAGVTLAIPTNVSADGRTFVGTASNNTGFVVRIDPPAAEIAPCPSDVNGDRDVNISDMVAVITHWGSCTGAAADCSADINKDHSINMDDLVAVINSWGHCR